MQKSLCISHGCFQPFAGLREREIVVPDENKLCM